MSTRYGDRGHGRYGDPEEERTEDRDYAERDTSRHYGESARGEAGERYGREYGAARRGGYAPPRGGGDYPGGREREYGSRDYFGRDYGARRGAGDYGPREYGGDEYGARYGRERSAGGGASAVSPPRRHEGDDYGRGYAPRAYGRDAGREYERVERVERVRPRVARDDDDEGVREYDTDYGRTTSRFYGRSGYEYGREDYDRDDDDRDERRAYAGRGEERGGGNWLDRAADQVRSWFGGEDDDREHPGRRDEMRARGARGDGKFRGRGPKNYRRSDDRLREEVCDHLTDNEWLDASDVEVNVVAGEVILTGTVDSRYAKRLAENIAESVLGVANVQNNLRVHSYQDVTAATPPLSTPSTTAGELTAAAPTTDDVTATSTSGLSDTDLPSAGHSSSRAAGGGGS